MHGGLNLEAIRNSPQIVQLREQLQQNPELAQAMLQQLAAQNPGIAQMIHQNPAMLADLLGIETEESDIPPGAQVISVTPEERAAIERVSCRLSSGVMAINNIPAPVGSTGVPERSSIGGIFCLR